MIFLAVLKYKINLAKSVVSTCSKTHSSKSIPITIYFLFLLKMYIETLNKMVEFKENVVFRLKVN